MKRWVTLLFLIPFAALAQTSPVGPFPKLSGTNTWTGYNAFNGQVSISGTSLSGQLIANVLDFGADPTGATDSTAAIHAAMASATAGRCAVYIPSGTYKCNIDYSTPGSMGVSIYGEYPSANFYGAHVTRLIPNNTSLPVLRVSMNGGVIENLHIEGGGAYNVGSVGLAYDGINSRISHVKIDQFETNLLCNRVFQSTFDHCYFFNGKYNVLLLTGTTPTLLGGNSGDCTTFDSCYISGSVQTAPGVYGQEYPNSISYGICSIGGGAGIVIKGCEIDACGVGVFANNTIAVIGGHMEGISVAAFMCRSQYSLALVGWQGFGNVKRKIYCFGNDTPDMRGDIASLGNSLGADDSIYLDASAAPTINAPPNTMVYSSTCSGVSAASVMSGTGNHIPDLSPFLGSGIVTTGSSYLGTPVGYGNGRSSLTSVNGEEIIFVSKGSQIGTVSNTGAITGFSSITIPIVTATNSVRIYTPGTTANMEYRAQGLGGNKTWSFTQQSDNSMTLSVYDGSTWKTPLKLDSEGIVLSGTASPPSNTTTPVGWGQLKVGPSSYRFQLWQ